jgi:hypothetical protein
LGKSEIRVGEKTRNQLLEKINETEQYQYSTWVDSYISKTSWRQALNRSDIAFSRTRSNLRVLRVRHGFDRYGSVALRIFQVKIFNEINGHL